MLPAFLRANGTSPRLRALQACQLFIALLSLIFTIIAAFQPPSYDEYKTFLFSLLYSLIGTAITTTAFVLKEHHAAMRGVLTKDKYQKYQLMKILSAGAVYLVGFIVFVNTRFSPTAHKSVWLSDMMAGGYPFHTKILWLHLCNWIFLWATVFYCCAMNDVKQEGQIRLGEEEAQIALEPEQFDESNTADDEAIARELQAQEPEWQA